MLSDFLTLELYFGSENSALYFEDLVKKYDPKHLKKAIKSGDLQCRKLCFGKDCGPRNVIPMAVGVENLRNWFGGARAQGGQNVTRGGGGFGGPPAGGQPGGGGGYGYLVSGGQGGFGGGGGASYYQAGANGGFGGGGGTSQYGYGNGDPGFGGAQEDAAAFGGGIFIRSGQLNIINSSLSANRASNQNTQGEAFGGALFIMHTLTNNNGKNQGMPSTLPAVTLCGVQFSSNVADTTPQTFDNNNNVFDLANISIQSCAPEMEVFFGDQLINDGDNTPSDIDGTLFENIMLGQPEKKQTFTISNSNIGTLILNGNPVVEIQQSNNQFSITQMPQLTQIDLDATTTFEITFTPTVVGLDQATLSIANNDPDENPYDFVIAAEVIAPQPKLLVSVCFLKQPRSDSVTANVYELLSVCASSAAMS